MKSLKMLPWVGAMSILALAFAAPWSASAATLCKKDTTPCGNESMYWSGTTIKGSLVPASTSVFQPPFGNINCKKSSFSAVTSSNGGFVPVTANVNEFAFSECNATVTVLQKGTLSVEHLSGSMSGDVKQTGSEITVVYLGFHCIFSTSNTTIGILYPAIPITEHSYLYPELVVDGYLNRTGGSSGSFCGSFARWKASYFITSPGPLYVSNI